MLGMVVWFKIKEAVGVGGFPVDRHGDRAIRTPLDICIFIFCWRRQQQLPKHPTQYFSQCQLFKYIFLFFNMPGHTSNIFSLNEHTLWSYPSCPWKKASWLLLNNQWVACVQVYLPTPPSSVDKKQLRNYPTLFCMFIYNTNFTCNHTNNSNNSYNTNATYSTKINYPIYDSSTEAHTMFSYCTNLKWFSYGRYWIWQYMILGVDGEGNEPRV